MPVLDAQGRPVNQYSQEQVITAINTLSKRNQAQQMQIMHMGLLIEFVMEKLTSQTLSDGKPLLVVNEKEYEDFSIKRYAEIQEEAKRFAELASKQNKDSSTLNLEE